MLYTYVAYYLIYHCLSHRCIAYAYITELYYFEYISASTSDNNK